MDSHKNFNQQSLELHKKIQGKIEVASKVSVENMADLSVIYTPGVAAPCLEIKKDASLIYDYTAKGNMVAIVTDGSAVLGLGDIGPEAALPVMEGKAVLFKRFSGIDAMPICLKTKNTEEIVKAVKLMSPSFGGINLEDISAPRCFEIEKALQDILDIPVFHDDQHGTAIIVLAGLINALKVVQKDLDKIKIVVNGAGAAGIATARFLLKAGAKDIVLCDSGGIIYEGRAENMNEAKEAMARLTNREKIRGGLGEAIVRADVFLGFSVGGALTKEMVRSMDKSAIVFALANPIPEIMPAEAKEAGAAIVATGRSDFSNQINNALAFPIIFKGAFMARAKRITEEMKLAAAYALASLVSAEELSAEKIIPGIFHPKLLEAGSAAVAQAAERDK